MDVARVDVDQLSQMTSSPICFVVGAAAALLMSTAVSKLESLLLGTLRSVTAWASRAAWGYFGTSQSHELAVYAALAAFL